MNIYQITVLGISAQKENFALQEIVTAHSEELAKAALTKLAEIKGVTSLTVASILLGPA